MTRPVLPEAEIEVLAALVAEGGELLARSAAGGHCYSVTLRHLTPQRRHFVIAAREGRLSPAALPADAPVDFDASITDVSRGGMGLQVDFGGDSLHPGMVLGSCLVERDGREKMTVSLEVRHTSHAVLPDGRKVVRAGCRFLAFSPETARFVEEYVAAESDRANP